MWMHWAKIDFNSVTFTKKERQKQRRKKERNISWPCKRGWWKDEIKQKWKRLTMSNALIRPTTVRYGRRSDIAMSQLTRAAIALVGLTLLDPGCKWLMEVFVLLEGHWRVEFGGQDHLGACGNLTRPLASRQGAAWRVGRGAGGWCRGSWGGSRTGPLLLQTFLPEGGFNFLVTW